MLVECDDPLTVHKFCSMLPAFVFEAHPVVAVADAIRVELEAIAWRDSVTSERITPHSRREPAKLSFWRIFDSARKPRI